MRIDVGAPLWEVEKTVILETLKHTGGDKTKAAKLLGIGRKTLYRKLELYGYPGRKRVPRAAGDGGDVIGERGTQ